MECVSDCGEGQVLLSGDEVHGLELCRTPTYFIDSSSSSMVELGTEEHPYKSIGLALFEISRYGIRAQVDWTINVRGGTTNEYEGGMMAYEAGTITV